MGCGRECTGERKGECSGNCAGSCGERSDSPDFSRAHEKSHVFKDLIFAAAMQSQPQATDPFWLAAGVADVLRAGIAGRGGVDAHDEHILEHMRASPLAAVTNNLDYESHSPPPASKAVTSGGSSSGHVYAWPVRQPDFLAPPGLPNPDPEDTPGPQSKCCCVLDDVQILLNEEPSKRGQLGVQAQIDVTIHYHWNRNADLLVFDPCKLQWFEWATWSPSLPPTLDPNVGGGPGRNKNRHLMPIKTWIDMSKSPATTMFDEWNKKMADEGCPEGPLKAHVRDNPYFESRGETRTLFGLIRVFSGCGPMCQKVWYQEVKSPPAKAGNLLDTATAGSQQLFPRQTGQEDTASAKFLENRPKSPGSVPENPDPNQAKLPGWAGDPNLPDGADRPTLAGPGTTVVRTEENSKPKAGCNDDPWGPFGR